MLMNINVEVLDIIIIVLSLLGSCGIGLYFHFTGGKQKTLQEYLLANKKGNIIAISVSTSATFITGGHLISIPSDTYSFGAGYFSTSLGKIFVVLATAFLYFPVFYKMQLISPFQYLEERFNYSIRWMASLLTCFSCILVSGITLYVPSLALQSLLNLSTEWSIVLQSVICAFYSTLGGINGVIYTDIFQFIVIYFTIFLIVIKSLIDENGIIPVLKVAKETDRLKLFELDLDPTIRYTIWSTIIGGSFGYLSHMVATETQVQRYMTFKHKSQAIKSMFLSTIINIITLALSMYCGLAIYAKYKDCDPVKLRRIDKYDEILPIYILDNLTMIPGIIGFFISAIMAASLSTVSSLINSMSAMIVEDLIKPVHSRIYGKQCPDKKIIIYAKIASLVTGILSIIAAFCIRSIKSLTPVEVTLRFGIISPMLGVFTLGMFIPHANVKGAFAGFITGFALVVWLAFGGPKPLPKRLPSSAEYCSLNHTLPTSLLQQSTIQHNVTNSTLMLPNDEEENYFYLYRISYMWYTPIGVLTSLIIGIIISLLTNKVNKLDYKNINPNLFSPPIANYIMKKKNLLQTNIFVNDKCREFDNNDDVYNTMLHNQESFYEIKDKS